MQYLNVENSCIGDTQQKDVNTSELYKIENVASFAKLTCQAITTEVQLFQLRQLPKLARNGSFFQRWAQNRCKIRLKHCSLQDLLFVGRVHMARRCTGFVSFFLWCVPVHVYALKRQQGKHREEETHRSYNSLCLPIPQTLADFNFQGYKSSSHFPFGAVFNH